VSNRGESGQSTLLLLAALLAAVLAALIVGSIARGLGVRADGQRAADLAALAGARAMHVAYPRLFEPARVHGLPNPEHLERAEYLALGRAAAEATARANHSREVSVSFPAADAVAPLRIRVDVADPIVRGPARVPVRVSADAELAPGGPSPAAAPGEGEYLGPFAERQGKRMRPDVAEAFDRMAAAAHGDGVDLIVNSAFRSDAEQAALFAAHPDPKWVARPGTSLHRLATELDLGPPSAYGWLHDHAGRFHFLQRYSWEPWHYGYTLNAGSAAVGYGAGREPDGEGGGGLPDFVPPRCWPLRPGRSRTSTRSRDRAPVRRASPSSCRRPPTPTASPTPWTPSRRSTRRPT
jgi:hypothetical protein